MPWGKTARLIRRMPAKRTAKCAGPAHSRRYVARKSAARRAPRPGSCSSYQSKAFCRSALTSGCRFGTGIGKLGKHRLHVGFLKGHEHLRVLLDLQKPSREFGLLSVAQIVEFR